MTAASIIEKTPLSGPALWIAVGVVVITAVIVFGGLLLMWREIQ